MTLPHDRMSGEHDHIWRCDCHDGHFLSISWHDADVHTPGAAVSASGFLQIEGNFWTSFRRRSWEAWRVIRTGVMHYYGVEVLLDAPKAREIAATLAAFADAAGSVSEVSEDGNEHWPAWDELRAMDTAAGRIDEAAVTVEREHLREEQMAYRHLEEAFPWVRFLPAEDARLFLTEIAAWRATAELHADP